MALSLRLQRLVNNVKLHVPGAVGDALQLELFNTLDEFFKDSSVWYDDIRVVTVANQTSYEISPTDDGQIFLLQFVEDANGFNVTATMPRVGTLVLATTPTGVLTYTARCSLTVVDPTDTNGYAVCPDWVVDRYGNGLINGIVGRLMAQPAKPYSNERLAIFNTRKFNAVKALAKVDARHENLQGGQRWTFPRGWGNSIRQRGR